MRSLLPEIHIYRHISIRKPSQETVRQQILIIVNQPHMGSDYKYTQYNLLNLSTGYKQNDLD